MTAIEAAARYLYLLWLNLDSDRLSALVWQLCKDPVNELYLSSISSWEIAHKHVCGRLALPITAERYVPARRRINGIPSLDLTEEAVLHLPTLPAIHRDPFDRMLICQAIAHGLTIVTPDEAIARYPVPVVW